MRLVKRPARKGEVPGLVVLIEVDPRRRIGRHHAPRTVPRLDDPAHFPAVEPGYAVHASAVAAVGPLRVDGDVDGDYEFFLSVSDSVARARISVATSTRMP